MKKSWVDKATEEERTKPKIKVEEFHLLESRAEAELRSGGGSAGAARKPYTNRPPSNISTGYRTRSDDSFDGDESDDTDPFYAVGSGSFFK